MNQVDWTKPIQTVLVVAVLTLFVGCTKEGKESLQSDNERFKVTTLFTDANGYSVHRFEDGGRNHYYVTPQGVVTTARSERVGKATVTRHEEIQTLPARLPTTLTLEQ